MNWMEMLISGIILILFALGAKFLWPLVKDNWIVKKAVEFVYMMEETFGAGTGEKKFAEAVGLLQAWLDSRGWKINLTIIENAIIAAVGKLHAEQGKEPEKLPEDIPVESPE